MILYRISYLDFESNRQQYPADNKFIFYTEGALACYFDTIQRECRPNRSLIIETFRTEYKTVRGIKKKFPSFEITEIPSYYKNTVIKRRVSLPKDDPKDLSEALTVTIPNALGLGAANQAKL